MNMTTNLSKQIDSFSKARLMRTGGALLRYEGEVFDRSGPTAHKLDSGAEEKRAQFALQEGGFCFRAFIYVFIES